MPPKTNDEIVKELPTNVCVVCGGDGFTVEHDPRDPTGQTPMQAQCDFCHAEGRITTLDVVRTALTQKDKDKDKEKDKAVAAVEKAYGGCHYCYGKGYGTQTAAWEGRGYYKKLPTMKFCTCERGEHLKSLLTFSLLG